MLQRTLIRLFENACQKYSDRPYLWEKNGASFQLKTYKEVHKLVYETAAGLIAIGVKKGDRIALLSEGRVCWIVTELAILYTGAVNVPFSVKLNEYEELKFRLSHAECRFCFTSGSQLSKVRDLKRDLPDLERVILFDGMPQDSDEITLHMLQDIGKQFLAESENRFCERRDSVQEEDLANICYTSGTISDPKGVMLTHRNYTANVEQACAIVDIPPDWVTLLILPWDHSFGHTAGLYTFMAKGAGIASVEAGSTTIETLRNISNNIRETRPHLILSVPSLTKNFRKAIDRGIRQKGLKVEILFHCALKMAYKYNGLGMDRGKGLKRKPLKPFMTFWDKIFFKKIRNDFSNRLEYFIGGGAVLDMEMQRYFFAIGIPIYQGYGLTEAAPIVSANSPKLYKLGTSGKPLPNLELRIVDEDDHDLPTGKTGEIAVKGENVMKGYWMNGIATAKTLRNGWLFTGDLGYLDEDGFLVILGRKKSLLISDDGEKFCPESIEEAFASNSIYIDQVMLYNSQSPYTVALIYPNRENLINFLKARGLSQKTEAGQRAAIECIIKEIENYKTGSFKGRFPGKWLPASIAILGEGFTEENRMMNSTMKMVRRRIFEFYKDRIDYLFTPEGKDPFNHRNMTIMSRLSE
ncbi:MAG: AMP-dependent synthetase/ligase [bacterium]